MKNRFYVTKHGAEENADWMRPTTAEAIESARNLTANDGITRAIVEVKYLVKRGVYPVSVIKVTK